MWEMTLSEKALAFSIQSLLSSKYSPLPGTPVRKEEPLFTVSCGRSTGSGSPGCGRSTGSGSPCSETSSSRDPKTPKLSDDGDVEMESSPEEGDQNNKKPRTIFTREQVQKLEEAYTNKRYLTRRERKELAADANISHTQVKIWFQNRRAKAKLKDRKAIAMMQSAMTSQRLMYNHLPPVAETHHPFLPPRPHNLIQPIPTKLPSIRPSKTGTSAFAWYL